MTKETVTSVVISLFAILSFVGGWMLNSSSPLQGSVNQSNEYHSTTTLAGLAAGEYLVEADVLGSVVITSSTVDTFTLYDWDTATTTVSTTIAIFTPNTTPGTYTFDRALVKGGLVIKPAATTTGNFVTTYR